MSSTPGVASYSSTFGQSTFDQFIARGQQISWETRDNLEGSGVWPYKSTIGLSASVCDFGVLKTAHVIEVLGTKYFDTDALRQLGGPNLYAGIGYDTAAMVLNDLSAVGAKPYDMRLFLANQGKAWFGDNERVEEFYRGWHEACNDAKCWFSGGETAGLHCAIIDDQAVFAGSAIGWMTEKEEVYDGTVVKVGDRLVGWQSRGPMCNGFTYMHTDFLPALPDGRQTVLPGGQTVGEAMLERTQLLAPAVSFFRKQNLAVRMINNVTGHGWTKLARAYEPFTYVVENLPQVPPIFDLMEETLGMTRENSYRDYNRGLAGVVVCAEEDFRRVISAMQSGGLKTIELGYVAEAEGGKSRVVIQPDNITMVEE